MIFAVALLLFGPRKLPEIGRTIGKALGEFRRASNDLQRSLEEEVAADELRQARREINDAVGGVGRQLQDSLSLTPAVRPDIDLPGPGTESSGTAGTAQVPSESGDAVEEGQQPGEAGAAPSPQGPPSNEPDAG